MSEMDWTRFPDADLQSSYRGCKLMIIEAQKRLDGLNVDLTAMQAELDRRALEAYWVANPKPHIQVDDIVAITPEFIQHQHKQSRGNVHFDDLTIAWVTSVDVDGCKIKDADIGQCVFSGNIPLDMLQRMRAVYLAQHPEIATDGK